MSEWKNRDSKNKTAEETEIFSVKPNQIKILHLHRTNVRQLFLCFATNQHIKPNTQCMIPCFLFFYLVVLVK